MLGRTKLNLRQAYLIDCLIVRARHDIVILNLDWLSRRRWCHCQ